MKALYEEVVRRFPEVLQDDYEDLPYSLMGSLVDWLTTLSPSELTPEVIQRVVVFTKWCEELPRGETAADDPYTVLVVGFYEPLFGSEATRCLIPRLISKDDLIRNAEYLKTWVGVENYQHVLEKY
jgi:hypothetical protein